jgi:hypothetical protein
MKRTNIKSIGNFLKEMIKSPWSYCGGLFFMWFTALLFHMEFVQLTSVWTPFFYIIEAFSNWNYTYSNPILLLSFIFGMIIIFGYKKHQKWAWTILFFALPTFFLTITTQFFSFMWYLLCDNSKYVCDGTTDAGFDYRAVQENPYGSIVLLTIIAILLFAFVRLYIKRKNYNVKNIIFDVLFWCFNISYTIFMIYGLIEAFTHEYRIPG